MTDLNQSPPTSPCNFSPPTSPRRLSPPTSPNEGNLSPPTSSDDSSYSSLGPKRARRDADENNVEMQLSRSALERRLRDLHNLDNTQDSNCVGPADSSALQGESIAICEDEQDDYRIPRRNSASVYGPDSYHSDSSVGELPDSSDGENNSLDSEGVDSSDSGGDGGGDSGGGSDSSNQSSDSDDSSDSLCGETVLYEGAAVTCDEAILQILKLYIRERWTKTSLQRNIKLIKGLLPESNYLPNSADMLLKRLQEEAPYIVEVEHLYCNNCQEQKNNFFDVCSNCNCKETSVFFEYPVGPQIQFLFEHRKLAHIIDKSKYRDQVANVVISDILDGSVYIKAKSHYVNEYDLALLLNVDGVQTSKSSKKEVWPILSSICEVPPELRWSYIIVCGVYVGEKKPNMNLYLKPFVTSICNIYESGGITWTHPDTKVMKKSLVFCPALSADAPARALVLNVRSFNHMYGCTTCEQRARKIDLTPEDIALNQTLPPRNQIRRKRRLTYEDYNVKLRDGLRMEIQSDLAERCGNSRKGVVGKTVLCDLPNYDRALSVCAEYLHQICLGVTKYFLNLMLNVKGAWNIGDKIVAIDQFIKSIRVPDFVKRIPRGLKDLHFLIGSEFRSFLLFYSLPALKEHLPEKHFQHWILLVIGIYSLLTNCITETDLETADIVLRMFVRDIRELYGDVYYTFNVHTILHLVLLVRRWGPLWATSSFCFEKFNHFIITHIHGTKHVEKELLNNIKIIQSVQVFENFVNSHRIINQGELPDVQVCGRAFFSLDSLPDICQTVLLNAKITNFTLYSRIKLKSELFSSRYYDETKKRANSFIQYSRENLEDKIEYGEVMCYVLNCDNASLFCLINVLKTLHTKIIFHTESRLKVRHLVPVESSGEFILIPPRCIRTKVVKAGAYLCLRPNPFEVNL